MESELVPAIDAGHKGATIPIDRPIHPRPGVRHGAIEVRTTKVNGKHPSAHEVAHDATFANITVADCLSCRTGTAVGAHGVRCAQCYAAAVMFGFDFDALFVVAYSSHAPPRPDRY